MAYTFVTNNYIPRSLYKALFQDSTLAAYETAMQNEFLNLRGVAPTDNDLVDCVNIYCKLAVTRYPMDEGMQNLIDQNYNATAERLTAKKTADLFADFEFSNNILISGDVAAEEEDGQ